MSFDPVVRLADVSRVHGDGPQAVAALQWPRARCDAGAVVLLVTHEPRYAGWADRVVFLRDGAIADSTAAPLESIR
ncbi:hypothetical protein AB0J63_36410 [Streptosporangium canum]|uniref:hypothetical protein n=1 Tax=Streptosporangium canum TaxID=324952 RepID=UPI00342034C8